MKGGVCNAGPSRLRVGIPRLVCWVAVLEWRGVVCVVMSRVWIGSGISYCPVPPLHCPALHCVCCHSIVGLGVCLCGRVALLWNGGDGLCVCWNGGVVMACGVSSLSSLAVLSSSLLLFFLCWCSG